MQNQYNHEEDLKAKALNIVKNLPIMPPHQRRMRTGFWIDFYPALFLAVEERGYTATLFSDEMIRRKLIEKGMRSKAILAFKSALNRRSKPNISQPLCSK